MPTATQPASPSAYIRADIPAASPTYRPGTHAAYRSIAFGASSNKSFAKAPSLHAYIAAALSPVAVVHAICRLLAHLDIVNVVCNQTDRIVGVLSTVTIRYQAPCGTAAAVASPAASQRHQLLDACRVSTFSAGPTLPSTDAFSHNHRPTRHRITSSAISPLRGYGSRLYVKGRIMGHKRSQRVAKCHTSLIKIEGVEKTEEAKFYFGKRVAYVYKATKEVRGSKIRVIWGRITRSHGNSGVVRAKFAHNIPPQAFAARVRIMLYPSSI
ncbi:60S ribosomal protein L33 [Moesziomyces antarcticus]|uniref:60S ribosomal protein L33 n=1 Tax=Pseudozyma antarctica TaxID=84753 RepID=A0A081CIF6_PSEA2|nr:60S ribosomal protein L33 [Moesziomyces antarcticus]GAK66452.1 60S ribosomal protein L33 [Moesziomyces antarcticus]